MFIVRLSSENICINRSFSKKVIQVLYENENIRKKLRLILIFQVVDDDRMTAH